MLTDFRGIARPSVDFVCPLEYINIDTSGSFIQLQRFSKFPSIKIMDNILLLTETFKRKRQHIIGDYLNDMYFLSNFSPDLPDRVEPFTLSFFNDIANHRINGQKLLFDLPSSFNDIKSFFHIGSSLKEINNNSDIIINSEEIEPNFIYLPKFDPLHFRLIVPENSLHVDLQNHNQNFDHYYLNFEPCLSREFKTMFISRPNGYLNGLDSNFFIRKEEIVEIGTSFLRSFEVPTLKFSCESTLAFEPFSDEWLCELQIEKEDFINFTNSDNLKDINKRPTLPFSVNNKVNEEYSPIVLRLTSCVENKMKNVLEDHKKLKNEKEMEREVPSNELPTIVEINSRFFAPDDIVQFASLFTNIKIIGREIEKPVTLTINRKLVNILNVEENARNFEGNISEYLKSYENVVITSSTKPIICACSRIKWRCITSHSQIAMAILPYLIDEDKSK